MRASSSARTAGRPATTGSPSHGSNRLKSQTTAGSRRCRTASTSWRPQASQQRCTIWTFAIDMRATTVGAVICRAPSPERGTALAERRSAVLQRARDLEGACHDGAAVARAIRGLELHVVATGLQAAGGNAAGEGHPERARGGAPHERAGRHPARARPALAVLVVGLDAALADPAADQAALDPQPD